MSCRRAFGAVLRMRHDLFLPTPFPNLEIEFNVKGPKISKIHKIHINEKFNTSF